MKTLPIVLGAFFSLLVAGCGDDQQSSASSCTPRCEEDVKVTCEQDSDAGQQVEVRSNCAEKSLHCALTSGQPGAVCALQPERLAECSGKTSICQSNYVTTCFDGYPISRDLCEATNRVCFGGATEAGCVVGATAEPKCTGAGNIWVCDGDVAIHCFEGRAAAKHECVGCTVSGITIVSSTGQSCI